MTAEKCYNITVTGKVQDIGLRAVIEYVGRLLDLSGLVFNARDGSVRVCCGDESIIREFFQEIRTRGVQKGAAIQDIKKQELSIDIVLPYPFSRVLSDEDIDLGRKLDKGNDLLGELTRNTSEIMRNTSELPEIKSVLGSLVGEQREHNKEQRDFNQEMQDHNRRLEKILEKLAEKA